MGDIMKKLINLIIMICIITFSIYFFIDVIFVPEKNNLPKEEILIKPNFPIISNKDFNYHNSSIRNSSIKYIVIHYTEEEKDGKYFIDLFNKSETTRASADYFVSLNGYIYQYNMEIDTRFSWAVGDSKRADTLGGSLYGIVTNDNSISVEMCVYDGGSKNANDKGWYYSEETIQSTINLVKYLMKKYDISIDNVIRHYDVSGKLCPGIIGWNEDSGSIDKWMEFKSKLE